jgi:hypothetical protein
MSLKRMLRRTNLLIYPSFQLRLIGINCAVGLLVYLVMSYRLSSSFEALRQEALGAGIQTNDYFYNFLNQQSHLIFLFLLVAVAVSVAVACITTLWISHKLAGPMMRLRGFMREVGESPSDDRLRPLRFRKNDCFRDIPPLVNRAVRVLQRRNRRPEAPAEVGPNRGREKIS